MEKLKAWLTSATTGQGAVAILGTALAYAQHTIDAQKALVGLVIGVGLVLFPEKTAVSTNAGLVANDLEGALKIYLTGVQHGMGGKAAAVSAVAQSGGQVVTDVANTVQAALAPAPVAAAAQAPTGIRLG